jgi:beta-lactamase superfamily II metal-dependent hydrolase
MAAPANPDVAAYYDEPTGSVTYLVVDPGTNRAAIIDPVLDYDEKAGRVSIASADALLADIRKRNLKVDWILDTHPHADHLTALAYLKDKLGAPTAIGERSSRCKNSGVTSITSRTSRLTANNGTACSATATRSTSGVSQPASCIRRATRSPRSLT